MTLSRIPFEIAQNPAIAEIAAYPLELRTERSHPPGLVDIDPTLGDFPRVADASVEARLILETVAGWPGNFAQPARGAYCDREPDAAYVLDLKVEITGCRSPARCERARCANPGKLPADSFQRFHVCSPSRYSHRHILLTTLVTSTPGAAFRGQAQQSLRSDCLRLQTGPAMIAFPTRALS